LKAVPEPSYGEVGGYDPAAAAHAARIPKGKPV
jgi:hypothetical protein